MKVAKGRDQGGGERWPAAPERCRPKVASKAQPAEASETVEAFMWTMSRSEEAETNAALSKAQPAASTRVRATPSSSASARRNAAERAARVQPVTSCESAVSTVYSLSRSTYCRIVPTHLPTFLPTYYLPAASRRSPMARC